MIINGPAKEPPSELSTVLKRCGWLSLKPGQIYALFWDTILSSDTADANKLMGRVMEIHEAASKMGIAHSFKTVKTVKSAPMAMKYPELVV